MKKTVLREYAKLIVRVGALYISSISFLLCWAA